jgi:DNA adenine methylase
MRRRIRLTRSDALALLKHGLPRWPEKTLIYLDPPYFEQGRELYYDYYKPADHEALARFIGANMSGRAWIVSYDNVAAIKKMYAAFRSIVYDVGYTARTTRIGKEVMFFSPTLDIPRLVGPIRQVGKIREAA